MATELSRGEILCRALCQRDLSKDWYLLSASEQLAMEEAAGTFAEEVEENAQSKGDLEDLETAIAARRFGFYVDEDGDEHFVRGDKTLAIVTTWSVKHEDGRTTARLVIPRRLEWTTREAVALIEDLRADGHEVVYEDEATDDASSVEPEPAVEPPTEPVAAPPPSAPRRGGRRRATT